MSTDDTSYTPQSPDLSSFYPSNIPEPPLTSLYQPPSGLYQVKQPSLPQSPSDIFNTGATNDFQHGYTPPTQNRYQPPPGLNSGLLLPQQQQQQQQVIGEQDFVSRPGDDLPNYSSEANAQESVTQESLTSQQTISSPLTPAATHLALQMPRGKAAVVVEAPAIDPSPVRTKFPTARIKRIMQADEEVGKVAQQTPIAVGKALEMFMIQLVSKSADVAKEKGSRRVTAAMLKNVVETDDQWDFLRDIVSRVENDKESSKIKPKPESESEEEVVEPKKKTRRGRQKKAEKVEKAEEAENAENAENDE